MLSHKVLRTDGFNRIAIRHILRNIGVFFILVLVGYTLHGKPEIANGASRQKEIVDGEGFGLPRAGAKNRAEKCIFARRAAEIDARRALAERIRTQVKATAKTVNMELSSEETEVFVNETLVGSKIVLVEEDDKCDQVRVKVESEINLEKITKGNKIDESEINKLTDLMIRGCSLGQNIIVEVEADGGLSFWKKGVKGNFKADKSEIPSIIKFIATDDGKKGIAKDTRECMQRYMDRIYDNILGKDKS